MKQPVKRLKGSHNYAVPIYEVNAKGLSKLRDIHVAFVRGSKRKEDNSNNQEGFITENLVELIIDHLVTVNVGNLKNDNTVAAIEDFKRGLARLKSRSKDRKDRNVQNTYDK